MEYYGNRLCISARELVDAGVVSQSNYQNWVNRGRIDVVRRGDPIATVNESGRESGVGLHYEIRVDGVPVNPEDYFITK